MNAPDSYPTFGSWFLSRKISTVLARVLEIIVYSQMLKIRTLFYAKNSDIGQKIADTFFWSIVTKWKTRKNKSA